MIRLLFFVGAGMAIGALVVSEIGPPGAGEITFPAGMVLAIFSGILILIARATRGLPAASASDLDAARSEGRMALARIDAVTQTGTLINDQPVCDLDLSIQPLEGPAYRARVRQLVRLVDIPAVQPGSLRAVALLSADGADVAFADDDVTQAPYAGIRMPAPAELGEPRLPEPGAVTIKGRRRGPLIGIGPKGRGLRFVLFALAFLVAGTSVALPYPTAVAQTITALGQGRLTADLRQPETTADAVAALTATIGHDRVVTISVSEDVILVDAPVTPGSTDTDRWEYRRGEVIRDGPAPSQPDSAAEQFSLDEVSWPGLWTAVRTAADTEGIGSLSGVALRLERAVDSDIDSPTFGQYAGPVRARFWFDGDYRSVFYGVAPDGTDPVRTEGK
ncbi:hypothetical protein QE374_002030 [Microbacterium sp. SORGH_AS428]|uniref:hypothetical protein n=1 Tax=Microbacterium sp. SORGH_AS_0428 TaxID=3041788 RepID=UPI0028655E73|nr:hypothetical protein [Microbacterium sp. SORGH_AS_0428]MDR6200121.1 hypothetical protein [Microbacterium sp. SORGH_AS_0428]